MSRAMRGPLATLVVVALVAAACGSGQDDGTSGTIAAGTPTTEAEAPQGGTTQVHGGTDCYIRRDLVVTDLNALGNLNPADFGLTATDAATEITGNTDASADTIDKAVSIYTTANDPLATAIVLRHEEVVSAAPVAMAAYAGHWTFLPGSDPEEIASDSFDLDLAPTVDAESPVVAIADTGLLQDLPGDLGQLLEGSVVTQEPDDDGRDVPHDREEKDEFGDRVAGHGTFVASVVRQALPSATLLVAKVHPVDADKFLLPAGDDLPGRDVSVTDELQVFDAMVRLSEADEVDRIDGLNLSLGVLACPELVDETLLQTYLAENAAAFDGIKTNDDGSQVDPEEIDVSKVVGESRDAVRSLAEAVDYWTSDKGWPDAPIYASAGNEGDALVFAPATFEGVVGVEADTHEGDASCFSATDDSYGSEIGENIVGVGLVSGQGELVRWSGTSFSAPAALARQLGGDPDLIARDDQAGKVTC